MRRGKNMNKGFSWFFLTASAVFFIFIVGLTGYRIEDARKTNAASAQERLPGLAAKARSIRDSTGGFDAPQFKKDMREVFDDEPRLLLLSVHSPQDGILYLVARNRTYMKEPNPVTAAWRGTPVYQVSKGYELLLSNEIGDEQAPLALDAMFVIMGREDLYPIVRDDLYLFLAFLLVCGVVILVVTSIQEGTSDAPSRSAGSACAAAPPRPEQQAPAVLREQNYAPMRPLQPPAPLQPEPELREEPAPAEQPPAEPPRAEPPSEPPRPAPQPPRLQAVQLEPPRPEPAAYEAPLPEPRQPEPPRQGPTASRELTSPRTGLVWAEHFEPRLHAELERAALADQDIALARVQIDEPFVDSRLPMVYAAIARLLREIFPLHDLIFEAGDDSYALLLPDSEVDAAVRTLDEFRARVAGTAIEGRTRTVSIGVSSRGGRLIEDSTLLEEANVSADKATREGGNQVIGFRADPSRYRDSLSSARS
jgi:GGDEF domain-containing protein